MNRTTIAFTVLAMPMLWLGSVPQAHAGRSCEDKPLAAESLRSGLALARSTSQALDATGAKVVVLARAGQDLGKYGLKWSHLGFAYRAGEEKGEGVWRVVHKLNACAESTASLYRQGLAEFFTDDPYKYEAAIVPLKPGVANRLMPVLVDNAQLAKLNEPAYSMVAYPWSQTYQQSNQWALETFAFAMEPGANDRRRAQAWLQFKDYRPTTLNLHAFQRLGARITRANIAFDDHPGAKRWSDHIETVTVDSVFDWLSRSGYAEPQITVR